METYDPNNNQGMNNGVNDEQPRTQYQVQNENAMQYNQQHYGANGYNKQTDEVNPIQLGKFRPLSPWAYFGYNLLFSIPLVGFILLIVFSFDDSNINRRNYARSFWCALLVGVIIAVIIVVVALLLGVSLNQLTKAGRL